MALCRLFSSGKSDMCLEATWFQPLVGMEESGGCYWSGLLRCRPGLPLGIGGDLRDVSRGPV